MNPNLITIIIVSVVTGIMIALLSESNIFKKLLCKIGRHKMIYTNLGIEDQHLQYELRINYSTCEICDKIEVSHASSKRTNSKKENEEEL